MPGRPEPGAPANVIPIRRGLRSELSANFGMALFLASLGIAFVGLFVGYLLLWRRAPVWPPLGTPIRPVVFPLFSTLLVLASSYSFAMAVRSARRNLAGAVRRWLGLTGVIGALFLAVQGLMWSLLWQHGLRLGLNNYAGMFYALTAFHALHVAAGLIALAALAPRALRGGFTAPDHTTLRLSSWFWHFITVAWIGVFVALWGI